MLHEEIKELSTKHEYFKFIYKIIEDDEITIGTIEERCRLLLKMSNVIKNKQFEPKEDYGMNKFNCSVNTNKFAEYMFPEHLTVLEEWSSCSINDNHKGYEKIVSQIEVDNNFFVHFPEIFSKKYPIFNKSCGVYLPSKETENEKESCAGYRTVKCKQIGN